MSTERISPGAYPVLWQLFGAYLNADWPDEYDSPADAVEDYLRSLSDADQPRVLHEIDDLLERAPDEQRMLLALEKLHSGYEPEADPVAWIRAVRAAVAQRIGP